MTRGPYLHHLRLAGPGEYQLELRSPGWIEAVETAGFGARDHFELKPGGHVLSLRASAQASTPREVTFTTRPVGAPVFLQGTRGGRALGAKDILIAKDAIHPAEMPARLPQIEPPDHEETENERTAVVLAAPPLDRPGVHLWLSITAGQAGPLVLDAASREQLKALGYLGN